jgi:hypothetical protein
MKKPAVLTLLLAPLLILAACAPRMLAATEAPALYPEPAFGFVAGDAVGSEGGRSAVAPGEQAPPADIASPSQDRLVVQTAALSMVVADPLAKATAIRQMAEAMGGYVVSSYIYQSSYGDAGQTADNASVMVRVPSDRLEDALGQIKADAVEVRSENVSGEDVTAQYVDLESRLRSLEATEVQLLKIMEGATKTPDALAVLNDLKGVQSEIESVKGQMKYYKESAAYSAISVELIPDVATQPIEIGGWQPQGTVKAAVEALINALQWLVDAAIWVGICILPFALLIGLPLFLILRAARRRRAKAGSKDSAAS